MSTSKTLSAIVERGAHAFIVLGPPGFQAECHHGHQWASPIVHGKHQARAAMQRHDAEHAGQVGAQERGARALQIAREFGQIAGDHHKTWVIEQMTAALEGRPADASRGVAP